MSQVKGMEVPSSPSQDRGHVPKKTQSPCAARQQIKRRRGHKTSPRRLRGCALSWSTRHSDACPHDAAAPVLVQDHAQALKTTASCRNSPASAMPGTAGSAGTAGRPGTAGRSALTDSELRFATKDNTMFQAKSPAATAGTRSAAGTFEKMMNCAGIQKAQQVTTVSPQESLNIFVELSQLSPRIMPMLR
eukprot:CAMPEP_0203967660 /NCGR_PEP_ID=MMETSP0359-20131031/96557_1 /ASSEMBLY_ACC=CAM_ASM_000338 /TAXON_ID=268821 /ORGANISM="Scrippsiella Hangoei, Strain SHTV-5" /LENGTH=189 /DNA_ID=CAMNT_0050905575 /DNA_START=75 /DNA_END=644 /DNA_ORIENTATION=+